MSGQEQGATAEPIDWYARRDELRPEMTFTMYDGSIVKLDRTVPGDGSAWYVAEWWNGWSYMDAVIEPGDLREQVPDPSKQA